MNNHEDISRDLEACVRCGKCLSRCPVFRETRSETEIARGKIAILRALRDGELTMNEGIHAAAENCLYCLNCQAVCPNELPMDVIIPALRERSAQVSARARLTRTAFDRLPGEPRQFARLLQSGRTVSRLAMRTRPENRGISLRIGVPNFPTRRILPAFASRPLLSDLPVVHRGEPSMPIVAFFAGCLHNFLALSAGRSLYSLLVKLGCSVLVPAEQSCCGLPFYAMGLNAAFERHAELNLDAFSPLRADMIISGCPSCVSHIRHHYGSLGRTGEQLAASVIDLPTFLWEQRKKIVSLISGDHQTGPVTWHDPCHLAQSLGVKSQPRDLLRLLHGDHFNDLPEADRCCGGGGSYTFTHYEIARRIGQRKIDNLVDWSREVDSQCDISGTAPQKCPPQSVSPRCVTSCPGCQIQLHDLAEQNHSDVPIIDLADHILAMIEPSGRE